MITYVQPTAIVAAVQYAPILLDPRKNVATALQLTFEAAAKGAGVVVLPELCLSGFSLDTPCEAVKCAQEKDGWQTEAFVPLAQRFGCHIVFGYVELCEGKLYNSAAIVGPCGLEGNAQKHNRFGRDNLWAEASQATPPVVISRAGRLGVLICRDTSNEYRKSYVFNRGHKFYSKGDVDTIALPTNWGSGANYGSFPDSAWVELSEQTCSNVIVSNRVGKERGTTYRGGACVVDRKQHVYTNGSNFDSEAVVGGIVLL